MEERQYGDWQRLEGLASVTYLCGYCGYNVASVTGYTARRIWESEGKTYNSITASVRICPNCNKPTYFEKDYRGPEHQVPAPSFGGTVDGIEEDGIAGLYNEARSCLKVNAYSAAVLSCRKLLMNIAVSKGAKEGLSFGQYVEYLLEKGYATPDSREWVDHIRQRGNEATHEIAIMEREDAEQIISFMEVLLKAIYEFPAKVKRKAPVTP